jgi:endonuclease-3
VPPRSKSAADVRRILAKLSSQHPNADTELHFTNAYELLVATILSAQCTDERVNQVTPALFKRYPDARALSPATPEELEPQIQSTGFFRAKSRALIGMANALVERHGGEVPNTMEALVELPGVGRKTANVVLGHALGVPGFPVDRHVLRVANRIGIARSEDPETVEQQLTSALPPPDWTRASDTLILHGRRICKPRPLCDRCAVRDDCDYYRTALGAVPRAAKPRGTGRGGAASAKAPARGAVPSEPIERGQMPQASRAAKPRATGVGGGAPTQTNKRGQTSQAPRAAKPRATGVGGGAPTQTNKRGQTSPLRRAAKPRGTGVGGGAPTQTNKRGQTSQAPRAAKPRGTGRGGGAPRPTKK